MNEKQKERTDKLISIGLIFNGDSFIYEDINFHWTDIVCMSDTEFDKAFEGARKRKKAIDLEKEYTP